jgi:hypothetical protein
MLQLLEEKIPEFIEITDEQPKDSNEFFDRFFKDKRLGNGIFSHTMEIDGKQRDYFFLEDDDRDPAEPVGYMEYVVGENTITYYVDFDTYMNRPLKFIRDLKDIPYSENCPKCGTEPNDFDGEYFRVNGYDWPAYLNVVSGSNGMGDYKDWDEVHCCNECQTIYSFESGAF